MGLGVRGRTTVWCAISAVIGILFWIGWHVFWLDVDYVEVARYWYILLAFLLFVLLPLPVALNRLVFDPLIRLVKLDGEAAQGAFGRAIVPETNIPRNEMRSAS